jgi:hypothetical protein
VGEAAEFYGRASNRRVAREGLRKIGEDASRRGWRSHALRTVSWIDRLEVIAKAMTRNRLGAAKPVSQLDEPACLFESPPEDSHR